MAGPYICIGVGDQVAHRVVLSSYATAHDLESVDCSNGEYICIGIGGASQAAHQQFLTSYASAHSLPFVEQETAC